jgi:hypothetical protein
MESLALLTNVLQFYTQFIITGKEEDRTEALQFYVQFVITGKEGDRTQALGSQFRHRNDARIRTKTIPLSPIVRQHVTTAAAVCCIQTRHQMLLEDVSLIRWQNKRLAAARLGKSSY